MPPTTPKALLACVGENLPEWHTMMENLVLSVRLFGGSLADIPIVVNVVGSADPGFVEAMERWQARVRIVDPMDPHQPMSTRNKLRMFELAATEDFDVLLALDCDLIVMGDLAPALSTTAVRAIPAIQNQLSDEAWERVYDHLDLPRPQRRMVMAITGERTYPYVNGGVLFVPHQACLPLLDRWGWARDKILEIEAAEPGFMCGRTHSDQYSLPGAIAAAGFEIDLLPLNYNLRTQTTRFAKEYKGQWGPPCIYHYHGEIDAAGFLTWTPRLEVRAGLEKFNRRRAETLKLPYHGLAEPPLAKRVKARVHSTPLIPEPVYRGVVSAGKGLRDALHRRT